MKRLVWSLALMGLVAGTVGCSTATTSLTARVKSERPLIIGHRGASGYRPEHTIEAYSLAIEMGVDYIEPDLVSTKDGILIARHENNIAETTNVAEKFPDRKRTKTIDGQKSEGYFAEDFTLKEIKTLRCKERLAIRSTKYDGLFQVPTFEEILEFVQKKSAEKGRMIGIYPELKHSSYHRSLKLNVEEKLVQLLNKFGYTEPNSPIFIQSFEVSNLKELRTMTRVRLVQLVDEPEMKPGDVIAAAGTSTYRDLVTDEGLQGVKAYADGLGVYKRYIVPQETSGKLSPVSDLVGRAHRAGLLVHAWTFRSDGKYLAPEYNGDPAREYAQFFDAGIDGLFSDFPDHAVGAVKAREQALQR